MKVPLTKWFISAIILTIVLALTAPSASGGFGAWFVRLADDPNGPGPEASLGHDRPMLLEGGDDEPQPEFVPSDNGRIYLEEEPPQPEFSPRINNPVLLAEPNGPAPECYLY